MSLVYKSTILKVKSPFSFEIARQKRGGGRRNGQNFKLRRPLGARGYVLPPIFFQAFVAPDQGFQGTPSHFSPESPPGRDGGLKIGKKISFTGITGKVPDISPANLNARVENKIPHNMTPRLRKSMQN